MTPGQAIETQREAAGANVVFGARERVRLGVPGAGADALSRGQIEASAIGSSKLAAWAGATKRPATRHRTPKPAFFRCSRTATAIS